MAIAQSKLGTFMGAQMMEYNSTSNPPEVGAYVYDYASYDMKVFDGTDWITLGMDDMKAVHRIETELRNKENLSDTYLEEEYPELKALKEQYNEERDKLRTFEILKLDTGNTNA